MPKLKKGNDICNHGRCSRKKYKHYERCEKCYNWDKNMRGKKRLERKKKEKEEMDLIIENANLEHPGYEESITYDEDKLEYVPKHIHFKDTLSEGEYIYIWLKNMKTHKKGDYKIMRYNGYHWFETKEEEIKKKHNKYKNKIEKLIKNKEYNIDNSGRQVPKKFYNCIENIDWCVNLIFKDKNWLTKTGQLDYYKVYKLNKEIFKNYYANGCMTVYIKNQDIFAFVKKYFKDNVPKDEFHYEGKWLPWLMEANIQWRTKQNMKWWFKWVCKLENVKSPKDFHNSTQKSLKGKYNGNGVLQLYTEKYKNDESKHFYIEMIIELSDFSNYDFYNNLEKFKGNLCFWSVKKNRLRMINKLLKLTKKDKYLLNNIDFKQYNLMGLYQYYRKRSTENGSIYTLPEILNDLYPKENGDNWYYYRYKMMSQIKLCNKNFKNMTMEMIEKYNIKTPDDWYKINYSNIFVDFICGSSLMTKNKGYSNLIMMLVNKYAPEKLKPEIWDCVKFNTPSLQQIYIIDFLKNNNFILKPSHSFCFENNTFTIEYKFDDCKNKNKLPFDVIFVYNDMIVIIEIDGIQHFDIRNRWNQQIGRLEMQLKRDKIKTHYMLKKNFDKSHIFIRIPYTKGGQASQGNKGKIQYEKDKNDIDNVMNEIINKLDNDLYKTKYHVYDNKLYIKQLEKRKKYEILTRIFVH